jgi:HAE1 family hydrophobic/amphiphilic exporter-1
MLYLSSTSSSDGSYALTVTFEVGTDLDLAQVQVQNRVAIAEPLLPEDVRRQGLSTKKQSTNILLVVSLTSADGTVDDLFLSNYARFLDARRPGRRGRGRRRWRAAARTDARVAGRSGRRRATHDGKPAAREQNAGRGRSLGQPPAVTGQPFQYTLRRSGA